MADYLRLFGILFFSLNCLWSNDVRAAYILEVDIHSYINPSGRCDHCREFSSEFPGCCDEEAATPLHENCDEFETCDTTIEYCFRSLLSMEAGGCPRNQSVSSEFAFSDINEHWPGSSSFLGVNLPITFTSNTSWTGVQLFLQSRDAIIVNNGFQDSLLIDSFIIDIDVPVGEFDPMPENFTGNASLAEITASFEVRCADHYYGPDCMTFCSNFENCSLCGLPGFIGEFCQTGTGGCAGVDCGDNGRECVDSMGEISCVCQPGFTGEDCEIPIDYCEGVNCSDNGLCLNLGETFSCECVAGYTGALCERSILCNPLECSGTGECIEDGDSSLCICDEGFTGSNCEIKLDVKDCENEMCSGNGCWQRDRCVCNDGFSGQFCNMQDGGSISDTRTGAPVDAFMRDPLDAPRSDPTMGDPHRGVVVIVGSVVGAVCFVLLVGIIILAVTRGLMASKLSKVNSKGGGVQRAANGYTDSTKTSPILKARTTTSETEERMGNAYAHSTHTTEEDLDISSLDEKTETPCTTPTMLESPEISIRNEDSHAMAIVMDSTDCHISLEKTEVSAMEKRIDTHAQEHLSSISTVS